MRDQMQRRTFLATTAGVGTVFIAGCSGGESGSGEFRLLISDQPTAIDAFDSLTVTLSAARVFRAGEDEELTTGVVNETVTDTADEDGAGYVEFDIDSVEVDLTQVKGDRAVSVVEGELEAGQYSGIELTVATAEGVVDGEDVGVMVPSGRLRIVKPFEVGADEELSFVFDITVIQKGPTGSYNLLPVIGKSGVAGDAVAVEEVEIEENETA